MTKYVRRLQRIGSSTLVTLPKDWVDSNGLTKNAEVELDTGQNSVTITPNQKSKPAKEITISYPLPPDENIAADLTGAYLLGYDVINIKSRTSIPVGDREKIRNSMRRLVGMEIIEEDSTAINMQFLLDAVTLNPQKILKRIGNIVLGMYGDITSGLIDGDKSNLRTISDRDNEVNRQYFLLVRLIRSTMIDRRLANAFNLENIDVLDYRIAANLLERAGDTIVELSNSVYSTTVPKSYLKKIHGIAKNLEPMGTKIIDAFINNDRKLAIESIALHKAFEGRIQLIKSSLENKKQIPIDYLDLVYTFERVERSWADIADLVKPTYSTQT